MTISLLQLAVKMPRLKLALKSLSIMRPVTLTTRTTTPATTMQMMMDTVKQRPAMLLECLLARKNWTNSDSPLPTPLICVNIFCGTVTYKTSCVWCLWQHESFGECTLTRWPSSHHRTDYPIGLNLKPKSLVSLVMLSSVQIFFVIFTVATKL